MIRHFPISLILAASTLPYSWGVAAEGSGTNSLNRFSFSARAGLRITARFQSVGTIPVGSSGRKTPDGDNYNYDNGYVLADCSGNAGGQTWYWGYDNPSQLAGSTVLMNRSTLAANASSAADPVASGDGFGGEICYNRRLGISDDVVFGLEAAANYLNFSLNGSSSFQQNVNRVTDAYPFTPGTTPPLTPPAYQGTFNGPGFLLGAAPVSSTTVVAGGARATGQQKYTGSLWGLRLGPYVEFPVFERLQLSLSGGFAVAIINGTATWTETVSIVGGGTGTTSGSGSDFNFLFGGFLGGQLSYPISQQWIVQTGVQYQNLGTYQHLIGGRTVELDLSHTLFISLGVGYNF